MSTYILRRIVQAIPVMFGITLFTFLIIHLVPGDPVRQALGAQASPEQIEEVRDQLGLNDPLPTQFWDYFSDSATGQFGDSFVQSTPVGDLVDVLQEPATDG